eukprot:jgi/Tetstr1/449597/TSEL_036684.t1
MQAALNTGWGSKTLSSPGTLSCDLGTAVPAVAGPVRMSRNSSMAVPSASESGLPTQLVRASRGGADTPAAKGLVAKGPDKPLVLPSTMLKWTTNTWGGDGDSGLLDEEDEEAESSGNVNFCEAVRPALVPTGLPMVPRKAGTLKTLIQKGAASTRRMSKGMMSDMSNETTNTSRICSSTGLPSQPAAFTFLQTVEVARAAKRLAKLQPRKPPHVQLATIMNESHDTRRRKILNRMLDDSMVKEHMVRDWLQDMGEVTVKARAGKQVGLNELKALREAFDEADSTKCKSPRLSRLVSLSFPSHPMRRCIAGVVGFGELHLEEEEPAIHPAWLPLRRMLQKILYDQENSSAFLRAKPKGAMKNAAFRKRVASRCVNFEDMLHASYPEIPPAELERLKAMSDHLMAKKPRKGRAPPQPPTHAAQTIFRLLNTDNAGALPLEALEAFFRRVFQHSVQLIYTSFPKTSRSNMQQENCITREEFVQWYLSVWRSCSSPGKGDKLEKFYHSDPITLMDKYVQAEQRRLDRLREQESASRASRRRPPAGNDDATHLQQHLVDKESVAT